MTNLLERAISADDGNRAAKIIQSALGIWATKSPTIAFQRVGPTTVSNGRGSSEIGWERKSDI
jgi:hypothetical protein